MTDRKHAYKLARGVIAQADETLDCLIYQAPGCPAHVLAPARYMKALRQARRQAGRLLAAILEDDGAIEKALRKYELPLIDAADLFEDGAALNY
ncbi:hypothetical protein OOZ54_12755 [Rhodopseudomonas palustris]|uniref:hypothetical protein n=1 Tax=Rhodopseudomonas palustris TaxID=1076 RepID=UPI0022F0CC24|nr:hypothetical protein [Rhodopseudomonas palustris]WBU27564.1 hypothetical protein OOZ54_12755 [Rhodopseudomonas palustris]